MTTITNEALDRFARELSRMDLLDYQEQVFILLRQRTTNNVTMAEVPNRHHQRAENFLVLQEDVQVYLNCGFDLLGYLHTHRHSHSEGPTHDDLKKLRGSYIGGVYRLGAMQAYWYNRNSVFHITDIYRPVQDQHMTTVGTTTSLVDHPKEES